MCCEGGWEPAEWHAIGVARVILAESGRDRVDLICLSHAHELIARESPKSPGSSGLLHCEAVRETISSSPASLPSYSFGGVVCPVSMAKKAIRIPPRKRSSHRRSLPLVPKT